MNLKSVIKTSSASYIYVIQDKDLGQRLDVLLAAALPFSRARLQALLRAGHIRVEGHSVEPKTKLPPGTRVEVQVPPPRSVELRPEPIPLEILFEDEHFLALNKPPGRVVHPSAGHDTGTLVHALLHHCGSSLKGIGGTARPGIVHRLDKDTSGLLLVAKTEPALEGLATQFKKRSLRKWYLAYLIGQLRQPSGAWLGPIGRDPRHRQRMAVIPSGRPAESRYRVLASSDKASRVEIEIRTGRTHQIRVHAAHAGHPVVGDAAYGRRRAWERDAGINRHMLHAARLSLVHPISGQPIELEAPEPTDFIEFAHWLGGKTVEPPIRSGG
ncbi:MAG: RluA family pseudouridine synthase [Candidatus Methylacidiphilales bacterium]